MSNFRPLSRKIFSKETILFIPCKVLGDFKASLESRVSQKSLTNWHKSSHFALSRQIVKADKTQRYLAGHWIRWQFIVERAPWWGGFYERLIGSVKRCLKKFPDIVTMVTEVEAVLNSRPLTYLYLDIEDNLPLTPAHFLCRYRLTTLPNLVQDKEDVDP